MSDLLREEQRLYEIEQKKWKKIKWSGWKHWVTIASIYAIVISFSVLLGWAVNSNEAGASFMKMCLPLVTAALLVCKSWELFLWKRKTRN